MNQIFIIAGDYLKGKSIYPAFRRLLNLLFNVSISSFIYVKFYGNYEWLNYNDYKRILDFFIKGSFFIPLSIFFTTYGLTQLLAIFLFYSLNHFKTVRLTKEIINYQVKKETVEERIIDISSVTAFVTPVELTKSMIVDLYNELKSQITEEAYQELQKGLTSSKDDLQATFSLIVRGIIAISLYFISLPEFGWVLYVIVCSTLIISLYIIMIAYRLLDILPTLIRKFHTEAENYLEKYHPRNNQE